MQLMHIYMCTRARVTHNLNVDEWILYMHIFTRVCVYNIKICLHRHNVCIIYIELVYILYVNVYAIHILSYMDIQHSRVLYLHMHSRVSIQYRHACMYP